MVSEPPKDHDYFRTETYEQLADPTRVAWGFDGSEKVKRMALVGTTGWGKTQVDGGLCKQ